MVFRIQLWLLFICILPLSAQGRGKWISLLQPTQLHVRQTPVPISRAEILSPSEAEAISQLHSRNRRTDSLSHHQKQPTGLTVRGKVLHLHQDAQVGVRGDLHLQEASIGGQGQLLLIDTLPQNIYAHQSSINQLTIDNPSLVSLEGQLTITGRLNLQAGTFDTRNALLQLADTAQLLITGQARLLEDTPSQLQSAPFHPLAAPGWPVLKQAVLADAEQGARPFPIYREATLPTVLLRAGRLYLPVPQPPPWSA